MSALLKVAKFFCFVGGFITFCLGVIGLVSCFYYLDGNAPGNSALCIAATIVAILVGLFICATELSRTIIGGLNNSGLRGLLYVLLVILPFWGWWSWLGSLLVFIGAILYLVAYCMGRRIINDKVNDPYNQPYGTQQQQQPYGAQQQHQPYAQPYGTQPGMPYQPPAPYQQSNTVPYYPQQPNTVATAV